MASATFGVMLMTHATPGMESQKLGADEVRALWECPQTKCEPQGDDHGKKVHDYLVLVAKEGLPFHLYFKMPFVENLMFLSKMVEKNTTADNVKVLTSNDFAVTRQLGVIAAVDMFIGNLDRFHPRGAITNSGNVVYVVVLRGACW
jgi:hypothetical protein